MSVGAILALVLVLAPAGAGERLFLAGKPRVLAGNMIEIREHRIRLWGIAVPEPDTRPGQRATGHLRHLLDGVTVRCETLGILSIEHMIARCLVGELDIAEALVVSGHATDFPKESGGYYASRN